VATLTYKPGRYLGQPIVMVSATVKAEGRSDPLPAWRHAAKSALRVVKVKGGHNDLLVEPQVGVIADMLDSELEK
jgi:acetoacetyl-CoA synthetase